LSKIGWKYIARSAALHFLLLNCLYFFFLSFDYIIG
jgi:hypothetical protein